MVHPVALPSSFASLGIVVSPKIIEALDNSIREELQTTAHRFFLWVLISAFIVAIGVALEGPEILHEMWPKLFSWFTWISTERLYKFERAIKMIGLLGWLLVVIGVMGEGIFEGLQNRAEGQLQTFTNILLKDARLTASAAKESAQDADSAAKSAQGSADDAQKKLGIVASKADELNRQLTNTRAQLDAVEAKRAALEKSLVNMAVCNAPRVILRWTTGGKTEADPLLPMAGQKVFIEFVPDAEARRAALNLERALSDAKWDVLSMRVVDGLNDGVSVQPSMAGTESPQSGGISAFFHASGVADKLAEFLHSYNWQAQRGWPESAPGKLLRDPSVLPAGAIRIQIGLYPAVESVAPTGEKELIASLEEFRRKGEEAMAEVKRRREETLSTLPPEVRKRLQESDEEADARRKTMENKAYPCQALNPIP
jgi:hypothetical protein